MAWWGYSVFTTLTLISVSGYQQPKDGLKKDDLKKEHFAQNTGPSMPALYEHLRKGIYPWDTGIEMDLSDPQYKENFIQKASTIMKSQSLDTHTGYFPKEEQDQKRRDDKPQERTVGVTIQPNLWYSGVLQPENILIHVTQNTVNFLSSTIAWFILIHFYQAPPTRRLRRSTLSEPSAEPSTEDDEVGWGLDLDVGNVAWLLRQLAETAEHYKRLKDEL